jgi:oxygen-dependent protoporphyrinogen oxidase
MTEPIHKKVVIIGAGISGLCCAHRLVKTLGTDSVCVLEASDKAGGYIQTDNIEGFLCDWGPNGFLDKEPKTLEWIDELGITDQLVCANEASAHRFVMISDQLVELKPPPAFLTSPVMSVGGKLRLMMEPLIGSKKDDTPESVWDFAARRIGKQAADNLVSAMVLGVYGGDAKKLSLAHAFPRMAEMEREHGSLFKAMLAKKKASKGAEGSPMGPGGTLTTFKDGIGTFTNAAYKAVRDTVNLNKRLSQVTSAASGYLVACEDGTTLQADTIICAIPPHAIQSQFDSINESIQSTASKVECVPTAVVCTGYDRDRVGHSLDGFGFLVPPNQKKSVMGCIWATSVFDNVAPTGKVMLRTMIGGAIRPDLIYESDDSLLSHISRDIHPLLSIDEPPEFVQIYRHMHGIPQYGLGHQEVLDTMDGIEKDAPGIFFTGNWLRGISMNDCVVDGYAVSSKLHDYLASI